MKKVLYAFTVLLALNSCKKDKGPDNVILHKTLTYHIVATKPSPADSARGVFSSTLTLDTTTSKLPLNRTWLNNFENVGAHISSFTSGFSISYNNANLQYPVFLFPVSSMPDVPWYFELNKAYEATTSNLAVPFFLGRHDGSDGWNYFVNNEYPPDADAIYSDTYTKVVFTKRLEFNTGYYDTTLVADGTISGYSINHYSQDPEKYVQRLDFTISFTALSITD